MEFERSDIQRMLLDSAERYLGEHGGLEQWRERRALPDGLDRTRWGQFAELGWLALPVPESAGGLGGSLEDIALLNTAFGKALATEPFVSTAVLGGHVLANAELEVTEPLLAAIAEGGLLLSLAHAEPGRDPLTTEATLTRAARNGSGFVLNGQKLMALDAPSADKLIVSAALEGEDGLALFLLDRTTPGLRLDSYPLIDGGHAADVILQDVAAPQEALLVGPNRGGALVAEAVERATIALLAQAVGAMEAAIEICGAYVKERKQFGVPIGSFQAIQHMLADSFVATYQARSMLYQAISASYEQDPAVRAAAISAAKVVIGESGQTVARNGIQVHGGYGVTDEYAISHYYRRLLSLEKQYGDIERHTRRLGESQFTA